MIVSGGGRVCRLGGLCVSLWGVIRAGRAGGVGASMSVSVADRVVAARVAVAEAAAVCRGVQARLAEVQQVLKDDKSPVTVADFAAQAVVCHRLKESLGGFEMVGEEDAGELREQMRAGNSALIDAVVAAVRGVWADADAESVLEAIDMGNADGTGAAYWTLDPIDGTKGFLRGQQYAVSLGWIEGGEVVAGALACPNLGLDFGAPFDMADARGSLYVGEKGKGVREFACSREANGEGRAVTCDAWDGGPVSVCASVEKAHSNVSDTDRVLEKIGEAGEPARLDSQCKYAVVARGQAHAYLRMPTKKGYVEKIWDHAAGSLIATEAGAKVSDIHGGALDYTKGAGLSANSGVVCAAAGLHERVIAAIGELGIGEPE